MLKSRPFKPTTDSIQTTGGTMQNICRASFSVQNNLNLQVDLNPNWDHIAIYVQEATTTNPQSTFILNFMLENEILGYHRAELPCPDNCYPPFLEPFNTFEKSHFMCVINEAISKKLAYFDVAKSKIGMPGSQLDSYAIYPNNELDPPYKEAINIFVSEPN